MTEDNKRLLNQYMNILYRLTIAEYYYCVEVEEKNITPGEKEYEVLCNLIKDAGRLYLILIDRKINPPIWGDKVVMYDKDVKQMKFY